MVQERPNVQPTDLLSVTQACKALEVNRATIYRWIEQGKMKCKVRKHNLRIVIPGTEILRIYGASI